MGGESKSHPTITIPIINKTFELRWLSLSLLIFQNTLLVLAMRVSRTNNEGALYLTSTAVITAEILKVSSCIVILRTQANNWNDVISLLATELANVDTIKVAVPGALYLVQNNLLFVAVSNLDAAVYQVTYQLKILTTAFFTVVLLGRHLLKHQMMSLLLLTSGVAVVQLAKSEGKAAVNVEDQNPTLGIICVLLACMSSGFAGVYFEKILKGGRAVSLWVRNVQLGLFGVIIGLIGLAITPDMTIIQRDGFFNGYSPVVWLVVITQAFGGLMIAVVIKYADNILKGYASSISIILSSVLSSMFFGFNITMMFCVGTLLVILAVMSYGMSTEQVNKLMGKGEKKLPGEGQQLVGQKV